MNASTKALLNLGLIILASVVIAIGLLICYSLKGDQQFMVGVVIVGVGFVLAGLIRDFLKMGAKA